MKPLRMLVISLTFLAPLAVLAITLGVSFQIRVTAVPADAATPKPFSVTMRLNPNLTCPGSVQTFGSGVLTPDSTCQITVTSDADVPGLLRQGWSVSTMPQVNAPLQVNGSTPIAALPSCGAALDGSYYRVNNQATGCTFAATPVATASAGVTCGVMCNGPAAKYEISSP